jgi:hypothetical protein
MDNLNLLITETIQKDTVLREGFTRGLISPRNFAAHMMKLHPEKKLSFEALRTAIRRNQDMFTDYTQSKGRKYFMCLWIRKTWIN